jgi:hypothetical protein
VIHTWAISISGLGLADLLGHCPPRPHTSSQHLPVPQLFVFTAYRYSYSSSWFERDLLLLPFLAPAAAVESISGCWSSIAKPFPYAHLGVVEILRVVRV